MEKVNLSQIVVDTMVNGLASKLIKDFRAEGTSGTGLAVCAVTTEAVPLLYLLNRYMHINIVNSPDEAEVAIDLCFETGGTCKMWQANYPEVPFYVLIDKAHEPNDFGGKRVAFPWECTDLPVIRRPTQEGIITDLLLSVIHEPTTHGELREGLQDTPARVVKAWKHWTSGYAIDIPKLLKVFEDGAEKYDEMVIVKDIPIYSKCEHHLADIFGTVTIAYIPDGKIVGLSKLSRLADAFARRLQVQERLTAQIADAINDNLSPKGVGVIIRARHMCMESRGVCQQGHHTITSALRGCIKDEPCARAEFMRLAA